VSEKPAIYPGTFDPITNGHMSIIKRALMIFDRLIIAILNNPQKIPLFSIDERVHMIKEATKGLSGNIEVDTFDGLLVEYAVRKRSNVILRGLRAMSDFEYEFQLSGMNKRLNPRIETLFMTPSEEFANISSSLVREILSLGGDISAFVPATVEKILHNSIPK
jgi:pantetheine-phosphate adenylyltransferase